MDFIKARNGGFTIIELLIATSVFSVILLIVATGLVQVGKLYYKGLTSSSTQEVTRSALQEIIQDFELNGGYFVEIVDGAGTPKVNNGSRGFCIGSHLYSYALGYKLDPNNPNAHGFVVRDLAGGCDTVATAPTFVPDDVLGPANPGWRELLGPNMRLDSLQFTNITRGNGNKVQALTFDMNVISGDDDLISSGLCRLGAGSQYCASSRLTTYAVRRLRTL